MVQRKLCATRATGKDTEVADKKDLQNDIIFKPFDEVSFWVQVSHFGMVSKAAPTKVIRVCHSRSRTNLAW